MNSLLDGHYECQQELQRHSFKLCLAKTMDKLILLVLHNQNGTWEYSLKIYRQSIYQKFDSVFKIRFVRFLIRFILPSLYYFLIL